MTVPEPIRECVALGCIPARYWVLNRLARCKERAGTHTNRGRFLDLSYQVSWAGLRSMWQLLVWHCGQGRPYKYTQIHCPYTRMLAECLLIISPSTPLINE